MASNCLQMYHAILYFLRYELFSSLNIGQVTDGRMDKWMDMEAQSDLLVYESIVLKRRWAKNKVLSNICSSHECTGCSKSRGLQFASHYNLTKFHKVFIKDLHGNCKELSTLLVVDVEQLCTTRTSLNRRSFNFSQFWIRIVYSLMRSWKYLTPYASLLQQDSVRNKH